MKSMLFTMILFCAFGTPCIQGQVNISETGKVVYGGDSIKMDRYAKSINIYIEKHYPNKKLPFVYIWNNGVAHLSYDNFRGNSIDNKLYKNNSRYDKPGIRISISKSSQSPLRDYLKLVDYGICNLKTLKQSHKEFSKLGFNDRPDELGIDEQQLDGILASNNKRVDQFIKDN